jgi:hypothetical protein
VEENKNKKANSSSKNKKDSAVVEKVEGMSAGSSK